MQGQFDREDLQAPLSEINMTPLVDVMLVLLVIFLVTAPMLNSAIQLNLPSESATQISEQKPIAISINKEGQFFLNDREISITQLESEMRTIAKKDTKQQIYLRVDVDAAYGDVSKVLGLSQKIGLNNIGFITQPQ